MTMEKQTYINMILTPKEKKKIQEASRIISLSFSSFSRMVVLKEADKILKENEDTQKK